MQTKNTEAFSDLQWNDDRIDMLDFYPHDREICPILSLCLNCGSCAPSS
ncbi:hypothetical protein CLOSTMETH_03598 [[Clostridium] methylpentosum DSM 5476]|uniref:Uncharacterized protein n=1 Tax=[Clostridium] methylpentosum DSM 5476 TaxID=537013 RepID=C0EIA3_9FIRM|nr:hypothetical protein CLOSTMETH_03598 [[Clostridium] methylpentosum DSM 5476]